jgi:hypothetical protein
MGLGLGVSMQTLCQVLAGCFEAGILGIGPVVSPTRPERWSIDDSLTPARAGTSGPPRVRQEAVQKSPADVTYCVTLPLPGTRIAG